MKIRLLAVGQKMPRWVETGYREYERRLQRDITLELVEINPGVRGKSRDTRRAVLLEGERMMARILPGNLIVALDVEGKLWSTAALAKQLQIWQNDGRNVDLLVGGPEGLAPDCLGRAERSWSLGPLTLPHPLVRVVVAEALYRAWSINHNHPYHRAG